MLHPSFGGNRRWLSGARCGRKEPIYYEGGSDRGHVRSVPHRGLRDLLFRMQPSHQIRRDDKLFGQRAKTFQRSWSSNCRSLLRDPPRKEYRRRLHKCLKRRVFCLLFLCPVCRRNKIITVENEEEVLGAFLDEGYEGEIRQSCFEQFPDGTMLKTALYKKRGKRVRSLLISRGWPCVKHR